MQLGSGGTSIYGTAHSRGERGVCLEVVSGEVCAQVCTPHKHHNAEQGSPNLEVLTLFPLLASRQVMSRVT